MSTILLCLCLCSISLGAGEAAPLLGQNAKKDETPIRVSVTSGVFSSYVAKVGIVLHDRAVGQGDVTISVPVPLGEIYAKVWASSDIDTRFGEERTEGGDEIQGWLGWKYKYRDWFSLDQSVAYFAISPTSDAKGDLVLSHSKIEVLKIKKFLVPYLEYRHFGSLEDENKKGGGYGWLGAYRAQKVGALKAGEIKLVADASTGYSFGALNRDAGPVYWQLKLSAPIPITKQLSVVPSFTHFGYFKNQEGTSRDYGNWKKPQDVFGLSVSLKF